MTSPLLRVDGLRKHFGATVALDGMSFELNRGEVHALIGENGAGKSTLMNVLAGAFPADAGEITIDGRPYAPHSPLDASRSGIALIHQELSLCPHLSVTENILMGREPSRYGIVDRPASEDRARELLANFPHPELRPDRLVGDLPIVRALFDRAIASYTTILNDESSSERARAEIESTRTEAAGTR